jgi:hypothetical protein
MYGDHLSNGDDHLMQTAFLPGHPNEPAGVHH